MKKIIISEILQTEIIKLWNNGISRKQISALLNISEHTVKKLVNNLKRPYKYVGKKFGRLTVLERVGTAKNGSPIVRCMCDCGVIKFNNIANLTNNTTVSCGCYNKEITASKNPWLTEYNAYIGNSIKKKNTPFFLTIEEFKTICSSNCFYCNSPPNAKMDVGKGLKNGIDRVDPNIGYVLSNCVSCCWSCNRMKSNMNQNDFIAHIQKIYNHSIYSSSELAISAKTSP